MSDVAAEEVRWLWYPYIPHGKLTIVQGDPGEGKTTFVLAVISSLTRGVPLPECSEAEAPMNVIYQTVEDGLADTIKPQLEAMGADCSRVMVIDESKRELTLDDERLEKAIRETGARLIVLDPLQAYLGGDVDMLNELRQKGIQRKEDSRGNRTKVPHRRLRCPLRRKAQRDHPKESRAHDRPPRHEAAGAVHTDRGRRSAAHQRVARRALALSAVLHPRHVHRLSPRRALRAQVVRLHRGRL